MNNSKKRNFWYINTILLQGTSVILHIIENMIGFLNSWIKIIESYPMNYLCSLLKSLSYKVFEDSKKKKNLIKIHLTC